MTASRYSKEQDKLMLEMEASGLPKRVIALKMSDKFRQKITEEAVKKRLSRIRPVKKHNLDGIRRIYREHVHIAIEKSRLRKWDIPGMKLDHISIKNGIEQQFSRYV